MNMDGIEITKVFGVLFCFIGIISAVILFVKSIINSFTQDSLGVLVFITAGGLAVGVFLSNSPTTATVVGVFLLILSGISAICLLIKAASNKVSNDGAVVLGAIILFGFIIGMVLLKALAPEMPIKFN